MRRRFRLGLRSLFPRGSLDQGRQLLRLLRTNYQPRKYHETMKARRPAPESLLCFVRGSPSCHSHSFMTRMKDLLMRLLSGCARSLSSCILCCYLCFCLFHFHLFAFTEAAALRSIVLRSSICVRPDSHTQLPNNCLRPFSFLLLPFFCFLGDVDFSEYFCTITVFSN